MYMWKVLGEGWLWPFCDRLWRKEIKLAFVDLGLLDFLRGAPKDSELLCKSVNLLVSVWGKGPLVSCIIARANREGLKKVGEKNGDGR